MDAQNFDNKIKEISSLIPHEDLHESTPAWAKFMVEAFQGLCAELRKLNEGFSKRIDQLEIKNHVNEMKIKTLEDEKQNLEAKIENISNDLEREIDDHAQYSRRNCLLLHGVPENDDDDIDEILNETFNNKLNLNISVKDWVDRAHRIGKPKNGRVTRNNKPKVRPIIIKFISYRTRRSVFYTKKNLKGTGLVVTESLTHRRYKLLLAAQEKFGFKNVWSIDGRIMTNVNNKYITINSHTDLL